MCQSGVSNSTSSDFGLDGWMFELFIDAQPQ